MEFQEDSKGVPLFSPNLKLRTIESEKSVAINNSIENT